MTEHEQVALQIRGEVVRIDKWIIVLIRLVNERTSI
jgi:hypothetical protein